MTAMPDSASSSAAYGLLGRVHAAAVYGRRVRVLARRLADLIPRRSGGVRVLDVGCGDGRIASQIQQLRPDIEVRGVDVLRRAVTHVPVELYDGRRLPLEPGVCDVVMFVDVLHHTDDPRVLLGEAARVAPTVIIKDHRRDRLLAGATLRLMDYVGNVHHGVRLPYNYWPRARWERAWTDLGLRVVAWDSVPDLYPLWARPIFGAGLHFITRLERR